MRFSSRLLLWGLLALVAMTVLPVVCFAQTETPTPTPTQTPIPEYRTLIPVGAVIPWAGNSTPAGWLVADGSCQDTDTNPELIRLFNAIGWTYGTCGHAPAIGEFNLPDLRGRVVVGAGAGPGLSSRNPGNMFGEEGHILTIAEMPSHDHPKNPNGWIEYPHTTNQSGSGGVTHSAGTTRYAEGYNTGTRGGDQAHNIIQPSTVLNYLIWTGSETLDLGNTGGNETPMPTGTPLPEITIYSTVVAGETSQPVAFTYGITAGDFIISMLLFFSIGLSALGMFFTARQGSKRA